MVDKTTYIEKLKEMYRQKTGVELSDALALEYFERLVSLISLVTEHIPADEVILPSHGSRT